MRWRALLVWTTVVVVFLPAIGFAQAQWNRQITPDDISLKSSAVVVRFRAGVINSPSTLNLGTRLSVNVNGVVIGVRDFPFIYNGAAGGNTCGNNCTNDCPSQAACTPFTQGSLCGACGYFFGGAFAYLTNPSDIIVATLTPMPGAVAETDATDDQATAGHFAVPAVDHIGLIALAGLLTALALIGVWSRRRRERLV